MSNVPEQATAATRYEVPGYISPYTGQPITRTPHTNPYNFEDYIQCQHPDIARTEANGDAYCDRMLMWDYVKYNRCTMQVWGDTRQNFYPRRCHPSEIERFLRLYFDDPGLILVTVIASCNQSSGYPLWAFCWKTSTQEASK